MKLLLVLVVMAVCTSGCELKGEVDKCISQELKVKQAQDAVSFRFDRGREDQWQEYKNRFCWAAVCEYDDIPPGARAEFDRLYDEKIRLERELNARKSCMRQLNSR